MSAIVRVWRSPYTGPGMLLLAALLAMGPRILGLDTQSPWFVEAIRKACCP